MRVLVAKKRAGKFWDKVGIFNFKKDGSGPVAKKFQGSVESYFARQAVRQFSKVGSLVHVDFKVGNINYRVVKA